MIPICLRIVIVLCSMSSFFLGHFAEFFTFRVLVTTHRGEKKRREEREGRLTGSLPHGWVKSKVHRLHFLMLNSWHIPFEKYFCHFFYSYGKHMTEAMWSDITNMHRKLTSTLLLLVLNLDHLLHILFRWNDYLMQYQRINIQLWLVSRRNMSVSQRFCFVLKSTHFSPLL